MATVPDKAVGGGPIDKSLVDPTRTTAGNPNSSLTPMFGGEIVLDTTNNVLWRATSMTNTSWVPHTPQVVEAT